MPFQWSDSALTFSKDGRGYVHAYRLARHSEMVLLLLLQKLMPFWGFYAVCLFTSYRIVLVSRFVT